MDNTNLVGLIRSIENKEILLPDFQRGFVWKDEMQKKLAASILTKMPLGSILLLEADAQEYGCKMIGRKTHVDTSGLENIQILLDGQQRITVLTNIFSDVIFRGMKNYSKELASTGLKKRFFIRISKEDKNDIWGLHKLCFEPENPDLDYPPFLSEDAYNSIEMLCFNKTDNVPYNPEYYDEKRLMDFCCSGSDECYRIPLFLLIDSRRNSKYCLTSILKTIADIEVQKKFLSIPDYKDKKEFIKDNFAEEYLCCTNIEKLLEDEKKLKKELKNQAEYLWADRMMDYLKVCIEKMDLKQIKVKKSDRDRAIDIYENLNLGGVTLSTFELVMAKAAKAEDEVKRKNLFDRICEYIEEPKSYPKEIIPDVMESPYQKYMESHDYKYSASEHLKCYIEEKNQLNKKYTDAFLDVLCLYSNNKDFNPENVRLEYIKREHILKLDAQEINGNYLEVCRGLDRACFYLQMYCGIRNINELNYNLMLVLLGYLFINDKYWLDKGMLKKLNAWYWSAIFSGRLDKDQNTNIIYHLKWILGKKYDFICELKEKMFEGSDFSDIRTVLMETGYPPKTVIKAAFCQYYLSLTYYDFCTQEKLSTLSESADTLEEHHILPLGNDEEVYKNKEFTRQLREDRTCIYNSPINFVYITKKSNGDISSKSISSYKVMCDKSSLQKLHLNVMDANFTNRDEVKEKLAKRYEEVVTEIEGRIGDYL